MSCDTNDKGIDLPASIEFSTPAVILVEKDDQLDSSSCEIEGQEEAPVCEEADGKCKSSEKTSKVEISENALQPKLSITMPSSHVVEISQSFYWPLYTRPIDWIFEEHMSEKCDGAELDNRLRRTAEELQSMSFFQSKPMVAQDESLDDGSQATDDNGIETVIQQLQEEKEDWFNDLSGGQKSKVELVRKVFLQDRCPNVGKLIQAGMGCPGVCVAKRKTGWTVVV